MLVQLAYLQTFLVGRAKNIRMKKAFSLSMIFTAASFALNVFLPCSFLLYCEIF